MDGVVLVGPRQQRREVHRRILERVDDREIVRRLDAERCWRYRRRSGSCSSGPSGGRSSTPPPAALNGVPSWNFTSGRSLKVQVLKSSECDHETREAGRGLAVVVELDQRVEEQAGGDVGRGVVDADLQRIEARDVELQPDGERAAFLLGQRRRGGEQRGRGRERQCLTIVLMTFLPASASAASLTATLGPDGHGANRSGACHSAATETARGLAIAAIM